MFDDDDHYCYNNRNTYWFNVYTLFESKNTENSKGNGVEYVNAKQFCVINFFPLLYRFYFNGKQHLNVSVSELVTERRPYSMIHQLLIVNSFSFRCT